MRNLIFIYLCIFLFVTCKKEKTESIPQDVTGKWGFNSVSISGLVPTPLKSTSVLNSTFIDTALEITFSSDNHIKYSELIKTYDFDNQITKIDSIYQCKGMYALNGNNLSINNIKPNYKPYFKVKDYTFEVFVSNKDTFLNITYLDTINKIPSSLKLGFNKIKSLN